MHLCKTHIYIICLIWEKQRKREIYVHIKRERERGGGGGGIRKGDPRTVEVTRGFSWWVVLWGLFKLWVTGIIVMAVNRCTLVSIHPYHQTRAGLKRWPSAMHRMRMPSTTNDHRVVCVHPGGRGWAERKCDCAGHTMHRCLITALRRHGQRTAWRGGRGRVYAGSKSGFPKDGILISNSLISPVQPSCFVGNEDQ